MTDKANTIIAAVELWPHTCNANYIIMLQRFIALSVNPQIKILPSRNHTKNK